METTKKKANGRIFVEWDLPILEVVYLSSLEDGRELWKSILPGAYNSASTYSPSKHTTTNTKPIDDYYSRPHIRHTPVPLIVGGSDGSGTRAVVQVLQELGVRMVVEDKGTLDVHGFQLFGGEGWPGLVSRVLNVTHSAVYDLKDIPDTLGAIAYADLGSLLSNIETAADVLSQIEKGNLKRGSSDISFGFKAPVSMLLIPFFRKHLPRFKYLHVVRDGRDIAFSDNQSPVEKFYDIYMVNAKQEENDMVNNDFGFNARSKIKSMQLWNEWNEQVYEYFKEFSDGISFDFLVIRSEDLLNKKYESLLKIADFVGSCRTPEEICCMSRKKDQDIGGSNSNLDPQGLHVFGAADFEAIRGRFHEFAPQAAKNLREASVAEKWSDAGSWEDVREKMVKQHHNDKLDLQRRLLEEVQELSDHHGIYQPKNPITPKVQPGQNLRKSGGVDFTQMKRFYNEHAKIARDGYKKPQEVKDRYGKWKQKLENNPELSLKLHEEGKRALEIFGYEPPRPFMDALDHASPCDATIVCSSF